MTIRELFRADARRYCRVGLLATIFFLGAAAIVNFRVDPFQHYRRAAPGDARFYASLQRYIDPGIALNYDYEIVITGTSAMENFDNALVERLCGMRTVNLAISAASAYEERTIVETALDTGKPKHVVIGLDYNSFSGAPNGQFGNAAPLPLYLYDTNPWNDYPYLFNADVLMRSLAAFAGVGWDRFGTDPDRPWYWAHLTGFSRRMTTANLDPNDLNRDFFQPPRTLEGMSASFEQNVALLVERHPGVEFSFLYPPYSILVWADFVQRDQLDVTLAFKRYAYDRLSRTRNAKTFDFQADADIVTNLDLYRDMYHYDASVNERMIRAVCSRDPRYRVTSTNVDAINQRLREMAIHADARALIQGS